MLTAAAMVCAVPSMAAVGVDDRLLDDVLEPLPDFFFLFLSPSLNKKERRNEITTENSMDRDKNTRFFCNSELIYLDFLLL